MRILLPLLVLVLGGGALDVAHAQWKWRDANGQITLSDIPPPREVPEKDILQRPSPTTAARAATAAAPTASAPAASAPSATRPGVDPELEARRKAAEQQEQARKQQEDKRLAQQRVEECDRARANLRTLESGMRMATVNEKGERIVVDDRQRAAEIQRSRDYIAQNCRGVGSLGP